MGRSWKQWLKEKKKQKKRSLRKKQRRNDEEIGKVPREERIKKNRNKARKKNKDRLMQKQDEARKWWWERSWEELENDEKKAKKERRSKRLSRHFDTSEEVADKIRAGRESGLEERHLDSKGRAVFTSLFKTFAEGSFVCEYVGERISTEEGEKRREILEKKGDNRCFIFDVQYKGESLCIDATFDDGRLGRLINHSRRSPNLKRKICLVDGRKRLVFYARRDIKPGEELLYDYNDRSRNALKNCPWLNS